jgi:hypothetical protein
VISPLSITDVLWDNPDAEIDYGDFSGATADCYRKSDDVTRQAARDVELRVDMGAFHEWVKKQADRIRPDNSDACQGASEYAYKKLGLSPKTQ